MEKSKVFFIMPFSDHFFEVYETIKREYGETFDFSHSAGSDNQQSIIKDIIQSIHEADVIVANLTDLNPNVFYELGIAHSMDKKVIIITEKIDSLPFDLKSYRATEYDMGYIGFDKLLKALEKSLNGAISGNIVFSNPIKDYFGAKGVHDLPLIVPTQSTTLILDDNTEKGFLDFLSDIETNLETFTTHLGLMTTDMDSMNANVSQCTEDIEKAKGSGSSKTSSLVQKEAKKIAGFISSFDSKLQEYNKKYVTLWDKIEKDILGLLENKYTTQETNKTNLIDFLKSLITLKESIKNNVLSMEGLHQSLDQIQGVERTMTQAARILANDIKSYITIIEQISPSIDRIIDKSRFVVGPIS